MTRRQHLGIFANAGLTAALATALAITATTHNAPVGGFVSGSQPTAVAPMAGSKPVNKPSWTSRLSRQFDGCRNMSTRRAGYVPSRVVVVGQNNRAREMSLDQAWRRAHDANRANDGWTVGYR
jgi:hypothetical protein